MLIGILSFQGDYQLHKKILDMLNVKNIYVNDINTLDKSDALIIPGGESTVISKFLIESKLFNAIVDYSKNKNVFGTCAGAIMMSSLCDDKKIQVLNIINIKSFRNSWGRQINSFQSKVKFNFSKDFFLANFIRAPKIKILSQDIEILSSYNNEPILVRNKRHLACSFHPELGKDTSVHQYFIEMINE